MGGIRLRRYYVPDLDTLFLIYMYLGSGSGRNHRKQCTSSEKHTGITENKCIWVVYV
jgi:hypothetical protein